MQNLHKVAQPDSVFVLAIITSTFPLGFSMTWAGSSRNKLPLRSDTSPHISNGNATHYSSSSPGYPSHSSTADLRSAVWQDSPPASQPALPRLVGIPAPFPLVSHAYLDRAVVGDDLVFHLLIPQASLCEIFQQVRIHNL